MHILFIFCVFCDRCRQRSFLISVFKGLLNVLPSPHPHSQNEREEFETDYKQKYERERVLLMEENKKLSSELDNVSIILVSVWFIVTVLSVSQIHTETYSHLSHLTSCMSSSYYPSLNSELVLCGLCVWFVLGFVCFSFQ